MCNEINWNHTPHDRTQWKKKFSINSAMLSKCSLSETNHKETFKNLNWGIPKRKKKKKMDGRKGGREEGEKKGKKTLARNYQMHHSQVKESLKISSWLKDTKNNWLLKTMHSFIFDLFTIIGTIVETLMEVWGLDRRNMLMFISWSWWLYYTCIMHIYMHMMCTCFT